MERQIETLELDLYENNDEDKQQQLTVMRAEYYKLTNSKQLTKLLKTAYGPSKHTMIRLKSQANYWLGGSRKCKPKEQLTV